MAVLDINSRKIYHRDLKPENFLFYSDKKGLIYLHLNDFGIAKSSIIDEMVFLWPSTENLFCPTIFLLK
jgi:serine/threonine protein kinase